MTTTARPARMSRGDRLQFAAGTVLFATAALAFAGYLAMAGYGPAPAGLLLVIAGSAFIAAAALAPSAPVPAVAGDLR
jgi:hypothetical protein